MIGCKCGLDHVAPLGSGLSNGFGLSFQDGSHTLFMDDESICLYKRQGRVDCMKLSEKYGASFAGWCGNGDHVPPHKRQSKRRK